ncbi:uncharacterized protein LOC141601357 [Silene latifolia]|uniref:uncharacterized protein LOC141601357 n=1 Tax=Silene latifolia TaxID=37657 RepID=UPI003D76BCE1
MEFATRKWYFRYHPMCKSLKLTHLLFADDLLMFSKGDVQSIMLILGVLATFSGSSGLKVNASKSEVVYNGVADSLKLDIAQVYGFQEDYNRAPLVAWQDVYCSKKEGGLGIKEAGVWNIASVGKLVNWIYTKADRLWVLWIDHVYMKGADWETYHPPPDSNWNWRNICKIKDRLAGGYQGNCWVASTGGYSISAGYQWLQAIHLPVPWYHDVWDTLVLHKQAFVGWLIYRNALNTISKLCKLVPSSTDTCVIYCAYASKIIAGLENWLQLKLNDQSVSYSKLQKRVCRVVNMAVFYAIWMERNSARLELAIWRPEKLIQQVQKQVHGRLVEKLRNCTMPSDCGWLSTINIRCSFCT